MTRKAVLLALLIVGLAASCYVLGQRARMESRNKAVEIVLDYGEIEQIAASTGTDIDTILRRFKAVGATSVAVTEQTMQDLFDARAAAPYDEHHFALDPRLSDRVTARLQHDLVNGRDRVKCTTLETAQYAYLTLPDDVPMQYLALLPVGLPEGPAKAAKRAGLEVVARLVNYPGATPDGIRSSLAEARAMGVRKVIFQGDQVLGFKGGVRDTAKAFRKNYLCFGRIEFSKQKGELELAEHAPANVVVVHSIAQNEMPTLDVGSIAERFQRAVRERGVRMCYVRMYDTSSRDLLAANVDYVSKIARSIKQAGYTPKSSHVLGTLRAPMYVRVLAGAGVGAAAMLLLLAVVDLSAASGVLWAILAVAVCGGLAATGDMGRKAVALLAAFVFPILAALNSVRSTPNSPTFVQRPLLRAFGRLLMAVATVVAGGLLVAGLLSARQFMLRIDQFMGIKAAHLVPVLVLVVLFAGGIAWKSDRWSARKRKLLTRLGDIAADPVQLWQAIGIVFVLGVVGLMVARSGNEPGVGVSELELKFRALLDKVLYVRPRTKEFLIGYPLLLAGIAFALRGRRTWAAPLVVVGSIGLISALNTFCHIHTPLIVSGFRVINGVIVGSLIGAALYWLIRDLPGQEKK